jgi:hypothetical protein
MNKIRLMPGLKKALPHAVVAEIEIPNFVTRPDVIVWSTRVFAWHPGAYEYCEVFAYIAPMEVATGPDI